VKLVAIRLFTLLVLLILEWREKSLGLGHFQGLFGGNAAGFAVTAYDDVLSKQRFSLKFFPHGFSETSAGFNHHFTGSFCRYLIASRFFLR